MFDTSSCALVCLDSLSRKNFFGVYKPQYTSDQTSPKHTVAEEFCDKNLLIMSSRPSQTTRVRDSLQRQMRNCELQLREILKSPEFANANVGPHSQELRCASEALLGPGSASSLHRLYLVIQLTPEIQQLPQYRDLLARLKRRVYRRPVRSYSCIGCSEVRSQVCSHYSSSEPAH